MAQTNGGTPDPSESYANATFKESLEELLPCNCGAKHFDVYYCPKTHITPVNAAYQSELDRAVKQTEVQARIDELHVLMGHPKEGEVGYETYISRLAQLEQPIDGEKK